jgi:Flp pilus assembly pilin Flp
MEVSKMALKLRTLIKSELTNDRIDGKTRHGLIVVGKKKMDILERLWEDEQSLEVVEYAIILGIIVVASLGFIISIGAWVQNQFESTVTTVGAQ